MAKGIYGVASAFIDKLSVISNSAHSVVLRNNSQQARARLAEQNKKTMMKISQKSSCFSSFCAIMYLCVL